MTDETLNDAYARHLEQTVERVRALTTGRDPWEMVRVSALLHALDGDDA